MNPGPVGGMTGKVMVCTGAGSGIGRATVDAFLDAGASVGVLEADAAKVDALSGRDERLFAIQGDARSPEDNASLVSGALERWERIDTAITFVGIFDHYLPLVDVPEASMGAAFAEMFGVNVLSAMVTARAVLGALSESGGSLVLTLSSSSFFPGRGGALYVSSKFALRGLVAQLAHEAAPLVRVNGVAPGGTVDTDLRGPASLGMTDRRLGDRPGRADQLRERTPLHVALESRDHVGAYLYLASDGSRGVTGEIIRSDGGLSVR